MLKDKEVERRIVSISSVPPLQANIFCIYTSFFFPHFPGNVRKGKGIIVGIAENSRMKYEVDGSVSFFSSYHRESKPFATKKVVDPINNMH